MKKQLIAVGLAGLLTIPAVSFGAEMAGPSLYGSFRTGLIICDEASENCDYNSNVSDIGSRWGIKGSHEVAEGLTASYKYEAKMNTTNAVSAGHDPSGRLSYISLSGGFGTVTLGQIWSASGTHYGFAVDPSYWNGSFGGSNGRNGNSVSYSSSAGDVSFQIDKVTGSAEKIELGATASFGPVGVGLGYWDSDRDGSSFTGVALTTGAAGVSLTIGLGSEDIDDNGMTVSSDISILNVGGSLGDSGFSYGLQVTNSDAADNAGDQNLIILTNSLGSGASLIFEHVDKGNDVENSSLIALKVDF